MESKHPKLDKFMQTYGPTDICEKCGGNTYTQILEDESIVVCKDCGYINSK